MHPVEFEPTISADERPHTYALDRAATGTGYNKMLLLLKRCRLYASVAFGLHFYIAER
jgi:hypothetical protein